MTLEAVIAGNLRLLLAERLWRHADLAAAMCVRGFPWTANTTAQVLLCQRRLSLLEMVGLCDTLGVPLVSFLGGGHEVEVPAGYTVTAETVRQVILTGGPVGSMLGIGAPASPTAAERKAMDYYGLSLPQLQDRSYRAFGTLSIDAERDRRAPSDGDRRRTQARRGHAMRAILRELA